MPKLKSEKNKARILASELQFEQFQERSLKKFGLRQDSNPGLPDTSWEVLLSHTLRVSQMFIEKTDT